MSMRRQAVLVFTGPTRIVVSTSRNSSAPSFRGLLSFKLELNWSNSRTRS
jgi:hypothetical protein